ncbi:hypothetical protein [Oceanicoccus sp. KOV_DT_Chl]|uniref:hypothetical protein n=1 Tax=Oceanicoccus sp. KOV_DT_Chl TaxID=1904639 RepID=UPI0011AF86F1|nr:hypothetical protein [Oceanicoccus sp. KOV_DT_Chl]
MNIIAVIALALITTSCANNDICVVDGPCFKNMDELSAWSGAENKKKVQASLKQINELGLDPTELSTMVAEGILAEAVKTDRRLKKEYGISIQSHYHMHAYDSELDLSQFNDVYSKYIRSHSARDCPEAENDLRQSVGISGFNVLESNTYELEYSYVCPPRGKVACGGKSKGVIIAVDGGLVLKEIKWTSIYN